MYRKKQLGQIEKIRVSESELIVSYMRQKNDIVTQTDKMSDSKRDIGERVIYRTRKDS